MFVPADPIMTAVVVTGVFIYFALKRKSNPSKKDEKSIYDIYREIGEQSAEYRRYQEKLKEQG